MEGVPREELRLLTDWLARRQAVERAVSLLTLHGPAAAARVHSHLDALRQLVAAEHDAFSAVADAAPPVPQSPLPAAVDGPEGASVQQIAAARRRRDGSPEPVPPERRPAAPRVSRPSASGRAR